jgi:hypothetical protein
VSYFEPPYTILAKIPGEDAYIVGDQNGNIGYATANLFTDTIEGVKGPEAVHVACGLASVQIPMLSDAVIAEFRYDASRANPKYESIELHKRTIERKWTLRLGFGPKSRRWLVQGELQPIE